MMGSAMATWSSSRNKIRDPLYRLFGMIDGTEWATMGADIKGAISGTGPHSTP